MTFAERPIEGFLDAVASGTVAPAGGSAAGVVGATAAALCEMGCIHAIEHGDATDEALAEAREDCNRLRHTLLSLADADAAVVAAFVTDEAGGSPAEATRVPLEVAESCLLVLEHAVVATERSDSAAVIDVAVAAMFARSALSAAVAIVRANVDGIDDPTVSEPFALRATELERTADSTFERVMANV